MIFKKSQIYLIIGFIALIIIFTAIAVMQGENNTVTQKPSPSPKVSSRQPVLDKFTPLQTKPILIDEVPFKPESEGGGVNIESVLVRESEAEILKILPSLPYQNNSVNSAGQQISILIPPPQYQTTPWVLDVEIYGIDYQVSEADSDYNKERDSFLNSASSVFSWIKSMGADPEKIIINWGDRAYIREQTQKWLAQ